MSAREAARGGCERCDRKATAIRRLRRALTAACLELDSAIASALDDENTLDDHPTLAKADRVCNRARAALAVARKVEPVAAIDAQEAAAPALTEACEALIYGDDLQIAIDKARAALAAVRGEVAP